MTSTSSIVPSRICLAAAVLIGAPATAQASPGAMAAESRSAIRITVSVMPRVRVEQAKGEARPSSSSNAPAIRYRLVEEPFVAGAAAARSGNVQPDGGLPPMTRLILVVPD